MKYLVDEKAYGFEFTGHPGFVPSMKEYIGKIGTITKVFDRSVQVKFDNSKIWQYPIDEIKKHLVNSLIPRVPILSEGVECMVSDDGENWYKANVIGQLPDSDYVTDDLIRWKQIKHLE